MLTNLPEATGGSSLYAVKPGSETLVRNARQIFKARLRTYRWRGAAALAASAVLSFLVSALSAAPYFPNELAMLVTMVAGVSSAALTFSVIYHSARKTLVTDLTSELAAHLRRTDGLVHMRDCGATPEDWWEAAGIAGEASILKNRAWTFWMGVTDNLESPHRPTPSDRAAYTAMMTESKSLSTQASSMLERPAEVQPVMR